MFQKIKSYVTHSVKQGAKHTDQNNLCNRR